MNSVVAKAFINSGDYEVYKKNVSDLLSEGKSTGNEQSEDLLHYTTLNEARMKRLDKTIQVTPENSQKLKIFKKEYIWLVVSEGWCGDAAQILPILNKMANESNKIDLKIVFRDQNEELMSHFLTNGGRAIPILIIIDKESGEVINHWGPRPKGASDLIKNYKEKFGIIDEEIKTQLQLWYLHDKGVSVQNEILSLMK